MKILKLYSGSTLKTWILLFFTITLSGTTLAQSREISPLTLSIEKPLSQYIIENWSSDEGLPSKTLTKVIQTSDGYLWIASYNGLYRFDGIQFKAFTKEKYTLLRNNSFTELQERKDGSLLIGTGGSGLLTYHKGKFNVLGNTTERFDRPIESICDIGDQVLVGTRGAGVYVFEEDSFWAYEEQPLLQNISISAIVQNKQKQTIFGTEGNGILILKDDKFKNINESHGLLSNKVLDIFIDTKDNIWIGTVAGVNVIDSEGKITTIKGTEKFSINAIMEDAEESIWISTTTGLFRLKPSTKQLEFISQKEGLPHENIMDFCIDREGSLWLATYRAGLARLKDAKFENYTNKNGLNASSVNAVAELDNAAIMLATGAGDLHIIQNQKVKSVQIKTSLPNGRIKHISQNTDGEIMLCTYSGLLIIDQQGNERIYNEKKGLPDNRTRFALQDQSGNVWVGTRAGGAIKLNLATDEFAIIDQAKGLSSNFIMSIEEDSKGNIFFGLNDAGLDMMAPDGSFKNYDINQIGSNLIFNIYIDADDNAWIASNAGITLLKPDQSIQRYTFEEGIASEIVFDIVEDQNGNLWCTSSEGVFSIPKSELLAVADGKAEKISFSLYGKQEGMAEKECTGASQAMAASSGKLYFPTLGGLTVFDPSYQLPQSPKPPIYVHQVLVDGQPVELTERMVFPAEAKRITFNYTALNLNSPKNMHFQYKLEGYEDWVNAGTERRAVYTNIAPGEHVFAVRASNNGVWDNEIQTTFSFKSEPHFYETYWFYSICVAILGALAFAFYRARVKRITNKNKELEELVVQRTALISKQKDKLELAYNDIRTVSDIGQQVTSVLDFDQLINTVYANIKTLMNTDIFGISIYDDIKQHLEFRNFIRKDKILPRQIEKLSDDFYLSVKCFKQKEPIFMNHVKEEYEELWLYLQTVRRKEEDESKSAIFVPLIIDNKAAGVITVQSFKEGAYKLQHLTILQALASYISVALANTRIYEKITDKNKQITSSIRYAETIQQAVLPSRERMNEALHEYFIIFQPKDIVSGDFYWFNHVGDRIYLAVVDCTGHGVPGAFMSMIGSAVLNDIVNVEKIAEPHKILKRLHQYIKRSLKQDKTGNSDGMDVALCMLEPAANFQTKITYAGAKRPLYYGQKGKLFKLKGINQSIGGFQKNPNRQLEEQTIILSAGDTIYLTSDGYVDQHSPEGKRFGTHRMTELIQDCLSLDLEGQEAILRKALSSHQKQQIQRDDITMLGLRL